MGFLDDAQDRQRVGRAQENHLANQQVEAYTELRDAGRPLLMDFLAEASRFWQGAPLCIDPRRGQRYAPTNWLGNPRKVRPLGVTHWRPTGLNAYPLVEGGVDLCVSLVASEQPFLVEASPHVTIQTNARGPAVGPSEGHVADGLPVGTLIVVAHEVDVPLGALPRLDWRVDAGGTRHLQLMRMFRSSYSRKYDDIKRHELRRVLEDTMLNISSRPR